MRGVSSVEIDRPIDEVFRVTTECITQWSTTVVEDEVLEMKPGIVGSTFRSVTDDRGRRMEFRGVVLRHEPPRASRVQLTGPAFDLDITYDFESLSPERTRVTQTVDVAGHGVFKVFFALFGWLMKGVSRKAGEREFQGLKRFCESGEGAKALETCRFEHHDHHHAALDTPSA